MIPVADNLVEEVLARMQRKHQQREKAVADNGSTDENQSRTIDALSNSTSGLFETMCGWPITQQSIEFGPAIRAQYDLSGIISISGKLRATVVLSLSKELAFKVAEVFLGDAPTTINGDVVDLVGELSNMVCGNAKERLNMEGLTLGLPTVVAGSSLIAFESGLKIAQLKFDSPHGPLSILLGVR